MTTSGPSKRPIGANSKHYGVSVRAFNTPGREFPERIKGA
jgi:hypothetical protein